MKKLSSLVFALMLWTGMSWAQTDPRSFDYSQVDSIVELYIVNQSYKTTSALAAEVNETFDQHHEKFRAVYKWIVVNIEYVSDFHGRDPDKIMEDKKAVCEGYSSLLLDLCNKIGVECRYVVGFCHADPYSFDPLPAESDHAWNIVTLEGTEYCTDITWATSSFDSESGSAIKEMNETYFLVNPEQFALDHLEDDTDQTHNNTTVTLKQFENYPNSGDGIRTFDVYQISPLEKVLNCRLNEKQYFKFSSSKVVNDIDLIIEIGADYELIPILFKQNGNDFSFYWEFETAGTFLIEIDVNKVETLYYQVTVR